MLLVDLVCKEGSKELFNLKDYIDEIVSFEKKWDYNDFTSEQKKKATGLLIKALDSDCNHNFLTEHDKSDLVIDMFADSLMTNKLDFLYQLQKNAMDYYYKHLSEYTYDRAEQILNI